MWRTLFYRTWAWVRWLFGQRSKVSKIPPIVYQFTHFLVVFTIFVLLLIFSERIVDASWPPGPLWFKQTFCGWVFLLAYAFVRLLLYLISLFGIEESSEFTDIDEAWQAGTTALGRNGFDLQSLPVFLVLGLPEEQEANLFATARMNWKISRDRSHQGLVLGFYANNDAIYISCTDVGALAEQLHKSPVTHHLESTPSVALDDPQHATLTAQTMSQVAAGAASGQTLTSPLAMAGHTILPGGAGHTMLPGGGGGAERRTVAGPPPKLTHDELLLSRRRLEYLCRLIGRERAPWCPINGALMAIPLEWSKDRHMQELLHSARQDAETLHAELEMLFPVVCVFPGLEHLAGISEFIERGDGLDRRFKNSRAGSRYPLGRNLDEQSGEWVIERAFGWFRDWVYAEFKKDLSHKDNKRLYRLLCDLDDRRTRLVGQLKEVFGPLSSQVRLAGCYFCACGSDNDKRAFVHDVLRKAVDDQDLVAYTPRRLARDRACRNWATWLGVTAAVAAVADVAFLFL